ncbi:MAG: hypothetical protein QNI96_03185 [Woeseiaceae bacterium]|nr:hypothetical protein [Woeseiaceae bacterium]
MKSRLYVHLSLLLTGIMLAGCDNSKPFTSNGGAGGGNGGGGNGGGPGGGIEPLLQFDTDYLIGDFVAGRISGDGSTMVWVDTADPLGTNPNGRTQLFAKDLASGDITQVTLGDETFSYATREWDISDNGDFVVFVSGLDIVGSNPNLEDNVFLGSTTGAGITQVTQIDASVNTVRHPQVADNGVIVFSSAADLTGDNLTGATQIFSINSDGSGLAQVTTGTLDVDDLALADDGSRVAFVSFRDPFGTNTPSTDEIFVIDIDGNNLTQLTETDDDSEMPRISDDGSKVAFVSGADHAAGQNTDGSGEVFVAMADGSAIVQVSNSATRSSGYYTGIGTSATTPTNPLTGPGAFDISGDGNTVVYGSRADHTGDNADGYHTIFAAPADGAGVTVQVLRASTVASIAPNFRGDRPSVVNNGSGVLFISQYNLTSLTQNVGDSFRIYTADIQFQ